ncbi:MAG: hypothetical protein J2P37_33445, partial [Ktedonobacteraceae bacterium]|nr:hypothetical protein [Ktedonobacteraceae bacterium]
HARYYDPTVGRFVSADTEQGNAQGLDPYAYCEGQPRNADGPDGEECMWTGGNMRHVNSGLLVSFRNFKDNARVFPFGFVIILRNHSL